MTTTENNLQMWVKVLMHSKKYITANISEIGKWWLWGRWKKSHTNNDR